MATTQSMQANYEASKAYASQNWNAAKPRMIANIREGIQRTYGVSPGPSFMRKYETKIGNATHRMGDSGYWLSQTLAGIQR